MIYKENLLPIFLAAIITLAGKGILFTTVDQGLQSGIREKTNIIARTQTEWEELWNRHVSGMEPKRRPEAVDFSREMIIGVFRGKTNGPFPVEVTKAEIADDGLTVYFHEISPPEGFPLGIALATYPFHIVRVEANQSPVFFQPI